jgi:hypothetical protein
MFFTMGQTAVQLTMVISPHCLMLVEVVVRVNSGDRIYSLKMMAQTYKNRDIGQTVKSSMRKKNIH